MHAIGISLPFWALDCRARVRPVHADTAVCLVKPDAEDLVVKSDFLEALRFSTSKD